MQNVSCCVTHHVCYAASQETLLTDLQKLTFSMFVAMCVLNGSDYTTDVHISVRQEAD